MAVGDDPQRGRGERRQLDPVRKVLAGQDPGRGVPPVRRMVAVAEWRVHGRRSIYENRWVNLDLVDVELPDGQRFEHHVVRMDRVVGVVVLDGSDRVLLLWRHRFITDTWAWELPMGIMESGESPAETAAREVLEETGWRPGPLEPLLRYQPANGIVDSEHLVYVARGAEHVGAPSDTTESDRVEWVPLGKVPAMIQAGQMVSGLTLVGLLYVLAGRSADPEGEAAS
jgi:8-oxo-dGTP pyrophosphatase MutT (NUDIX family)